MSLRQKQFNLSLFPKDKQILVRDKQKVMLNAARLPISGCSTVVLFFDYQLLEFKSGI